MNSFIITSKDPAKQEEYLNSFIKKHTISPFDIIKILEETQTDSGRQRSIGIELVRKLQQTIFLKPFKGDAKVVIIEHAQHLTTEAQNALLKLLEEPPTYVYIFLCSNTEEAFLPTILSRCTLITLAQEKILSNAAQEDVLQQQYACITSGSIGEKLALAEILSLDKENLDTWFGSMLLFVQRKMIDDVNSRNNTRPSAATIAQLLLEGHRIYSTTNVNPRSLLEHVFLN